MRVILKIICCCTCVAGVSAHAQHVISGVEALERFGVDLETTEVKVEAVASGLHVLYGAGGNIVASTGSQGVLIVDDQFPEMAPRIRNAIANLGGGDIDFVINTHWHFDHADGNPVLGADGSWIVAHANSRQMMLNRQLIDLVGFHVEQPPYPTEGLPVITYQDHMQFHFNGERIELLHFGPAHTTGDAVVVFRDSNVVHMGDLYFSASYPFIDAGNGGELDGFIRSCDAVLDEIDEDTVVVPGHGPTTGYAELREYSAMLKTIRDRIAALMAKGATLEEVIAARPTAEWDELKGDPTRLLDRAYASMAK